MMLINPFMVAPAAVANMLTNGGFTAPASEWTLLNNSGSSTKSGGKIHFGDDAGDVDRVSQTVAGLTNGVSYILAGTISNRTRGGLIMLAGGTSGGAAITTNGVFSRTVTAGATGIVQFGTGASGGVFDLDDVSCVPA